MNVFNAQSMYWMQSMHNQCIECTINVLNAQSIYWMHNQCIECTINVSNAMHNQCIEWMNNQCIECNAQPMYWMQLMRNQCIECNWCTINVEQWWWQDTCSFGREQTSHQGYSSSRNALYASCACCLTNTTNVKLLGEILMHNFWYALWA